MAWKITLQQVDDGASIQTPRVLGQSDASIGGGAATLPQGNRVFCGRLSTTQVIHISQYISLAMLGTVTTAVESAIDGIS